MSDELPGEADVIVCGGGGAGCCVAARLAAARPDLSILLLEQGADNREVSRLDNPLDSLFWFFKQNPYLTWLECLPQEELNRRRPRIPIANILGGGTSINTLMYNTPAPSDFDDWDMPGWSYKDLEPLIRRSINYNVPSDQPPDPHGKEGPFEVSLGGHTMDWGDDFIRAVQVARPVTKSLDYLTKYSPDCSQAVSRQPKLIRGDGVRSNTAHSYIHCQSRPNLRVITRAQISQVLVTNGITTGVEVFRISRSTGERTKSRIQAKRLVVLTCGTLGSPCVLERSGVGDPKVLERAGVAVKVDLPGVGAELDDHQLTWGTYHSSKTDEFDAYARDDPGVRAKVNEEWQTTGKGIAASNGFDWGYKVRPSDEEIKQLGSDFDRYWREVGASKPDKPLYSYVSIPYFYSHNPRPDSGNYFCLAGFHNYPKSRGFIHITSPDPAVPPMVHAGLLTDPADLPVHVWHYKIQREIARRFPYYRGEEPGSHPAFSSDSPARLVLPTEPFSYPDEHLSYTADEDKLIEEWARNQVATAYHSISTCPMRPREERGVVDSRLNVYGVERLKVADLSICPKNVSSNTTSVVLLIAERAVDIILEELA